MRQNGGGMPRNGLAQGMACGGMPRNGLAQGMACGGTVQRRGGGESVPRFFSTSSAGDGGPLPMLLDFGIFIGVIFAGFYGQVFTVFCVTQNGSHLLFYNPPIVAFLSDVSFLSNSSSEV
jgi:hypothetical protein